MEGRKCRVCGSAELKPIIMLPNYPVVAGPVTRVPKIVPTCDLEVGLCQCCGTCVLLNADADKLTYDDDYTSSNIAYGQVKGMDELTNRFTNFIGRAYKPRRSKVLEIGCYDGTFMGLLEKRYKFDMAGCEPCATFAEEAKRKGYNVAHQAFNVDNYDGLDMIVARNILEHIPSPRQFVRGTASVLKRDGTLVLEVPAGEHFISSGILGTIVPEHPCYFGCGSLKRLLGTHFGSVVIEEDRATICALACLPRDAFRGKGDIADITQLRTGERIRQTRYDAVKKTTGNDEVDIFGANTCALELIAARVVSMEQIGEVYDDDPRRWGRYLVNTNLIVLPRTAVGEGKQRKMIVCSYTHRQSIANYITKQNNIAVMLYGDDE